jgi:diguanylate cyclase (GGDEF)-like protein
MNSTAKKSHFQCFMDICLQHNARYFLLAVLCTHLLQLPVCLLLNSLSLFWLNCISCIINLLLLCLEKKRTALAATGAEVEMIFFALAASAIAGLSSGFFLYLLCLLTLNFYLGNAVEQGSVPATAIQVLDLAGIAALLCLNGKIPLQISSFPVPTDLSLFTLFSMNLCICIFFTLMSVSLAGQAMRRQNRVLEAVNHNLEYIASHDPLTGLQNRRNLYEQLEALCRDADTKGLAFCAAMADIDDFKSFNDQYGHNHGDLILTTIADCICSCTRESDIICRWGGEEILILFPHTSMTAAKAVLIRIQAKLHRLTAEATAPFFREVTMTFGLTQYSTGQSARELVEETDRLLYEGKETGKDRVME